MKSVIERNNVQRMGVRSESTFRIKATGKAFRILSDGLYSDKITAVIRELSCNAYDAHVAAGTLNKPFVIHLPTKFEPFFSLRDYGIGLRHRDVMQVYTTYFESTKTESNDFIGCLGLGSKSPFSYVDNFTIISYYNGLKRTYGAFMNEDGIPSIVLMNRGTTDEHNGIEVSFAVNNSDFHDFSNRVPNVFRYFQLKPEITGNRSVEISKVEYGLEGTGWGIRKDENSYRHGGARAIMGNVSYPLSDMSSDKVTEQEWSLITSNIDIRFEIGELEVAASRENISFNKATIDNVKARLAMLVKEVSEKVSEELNNCPTLLDARIRAIELSNGTYSSLKSIFNLKSITYKGNEVWDGITSSIVSIPNDIHDNLRITLFSLSPRHRRRNRYSSYDDSEVINTIQDPNGIMIKSNGIKFFLKDIDKGSHIRCKQVINDGEYKNVYLLDSNDMSLVKNLMELVGFEGDIEPISSIERTKSMRNRDRAEYNPMNAKRALIYQMDETKHEHGENKSYWVDDKIDEDEGGIYVEMSRYKISNGDIASTHINRYLHGLIQLGVDTSDIKIVGVKESKWHDFSQNPKWKRLKDYAIEKFKEYLELNNMNDHIAKHNVYRNSFVSTSDNIARMIRNDVNVWSELEDGSMFNCVKTMIDLKESYEIAVKIVKVANSFYFNVDMSDDTIQKKVDALMEDIDSKIQAIKKDYPMLNIVASAYNYDPAIVIDYIKLVDASKK